jgi:hypothetical protein
MVLVSRGASLVELFRRHLPDVWASFEPALGLDAAGRAAHFASQYDWLPSSDFSRDVLGRANGLALYTWPLALGWSDLGTPDRLSRWDVARHALHHAQPSTP